MGVALITWGRFPTKDGNITVPAPSTDGADVEWHWDFLAKRAHRLRQVAFKALQGPPCSKAQGGAGVGCDGYGVFDPYDLGSKNQQGSIPTRYGTAESLRRLIAVCHANDMQFYHDVVLHQRIGANAGAATYRFVGADGKTLNGRWPMDPGCFRGQKVIKVKMVITIAEDDVPNVYWDISFGDEVSHQHCEPTRYTIDGSTAWGNWLFETTDADGMRIDDVKGLWAPFVHEFCTSGRMANVFKYAEYFDGPAPIEGWAEGSAMHGICNVEDFPTKFGIQYSCNGDTTWPMNNGGIADTDGPLAVTFVDNPDTDSSPGEQTINAKLLGYVELLTKPGYPFVYGKDYWLPEDMPGCYGLQPWIDTLVGVHENLMFGNPDVLFNDNTFRVKMSHGYPGLLTAMNFDTWNEREYSGPTTFGPNVKLHDYAGHIDDVWTDGNGHVSFKVPSNAYNKGQSYVLLSRAGYWSVGDIPKRSTTQAFFGATDLDIGCGENGTLEVGRIYVDAGSSLSLELELETEGWAKETVVEAVITGPDDVVRAYCHVTQTFGGSGYGLAEAKGWHTLSLKSVQLPAAAPFKFTVTYTAPQEVE